MINNNLCIQRFNGVKGTRINNCYISPLFSERYRTEQNTTLFSNESQSTRRWNMRKKKIQI